MQHTETSPTDDSDDDQAVTDMTVEGYHELFGDILTMHRNEICSMGATASRPTTPNKPVNTGIFAPISLDGVLVQGYVDTGASHSIVSAELFRQLTSETQATFTEPEAGQMISLGVKGYLAPRPGKAKIPVVWREKAFEFEFDVGLPPERIEAILGRDIQRVLGIAITGLDLPVARSPTTDFISDESLVKTDDCGADHPLSSHSRLRQAIARNQAIPTDSFCKLPEAVVHFDTGDHAPIYRRQYRSPNACEWLSTPKFGAGSTTARSQRLRQAVNGTFRFLWH
jgi:hypothetical protein